MAIALTGTVALTETSSGTTLAVAVPSGSVAGEVLVAVVTATRTATGNTVTAPSGWTSVITKADSTATGLVQGMWYRVVTATAEPSTYTWTASVSGRMTGVIQRMSGVDTTTPLDAAAVSMADPNTGSTITGTVVQPSITTVTAGALIIIGSGINASNSATFTIPSGITQITTSAGTGRKTYVSQLPRPSTGATGTYSWTSSNTTLQTVVIAAAFRPAGAAVTPTMVDRMVGVTGVVAVSTTNATSVRLKVGTNSAVTTGVVYTAAKTPDAQGGTFHTVAGLTGGTQYYYRVAMTDSGSTETLDSSSTVGRIKVAPNGPASFAFNFGSCTNAADTATMATIAARGDDLFFHLGDLYYADASGTGVANIRSKMSAMIAAPNHQLVLATTPSTYTPSDHDGMNNNVAAGSDATAWTNWNSVYREQIPTPALPSVGVYYTFTWGRVRFIHLDTRSAKSAPSATDNASKTALGTTQKQWLKDTITNCAEPLIILIQADPWIGPAVAGDDSWAGFATERTELAAFFAASGKKIGMLGGDMHALAADDGTNSPGGIFVYQAAPLINNASQKGGPYSVGPYPASGTAVVSQYGRCVITDNGTSISAAFTGYSSDNTSRMTQTNTVTVPTPDAVVTRSLNQLTVFSDWLTANSVKGLIGEFGIMNQVDAANQQKWVDLGNAYNSALSARDIVSLQWAGGRIFSDTDPQAVVYAGTGNYGVSANVEATNSGPLRSAVTSRPASVGLNMSGGEFNAANGTDSGATLPNGTLYSNFNPGVHGTDYGYPVAADWAKLAGMGVKLVRLPFSWERIQRTLNGALDTTEVNNLKATLTDASSNGVQVLLDLHNYAQYYSGTSTTARTILYMGASGAALTESHLLDLWTKVNTALASYTNIYGFDLMNEPAVRDNANSYVDPAQAVANWKRISSAVVNGLRTAGVTKKLVVSGWWGAPPIEWVQKHGNTGWITDSANNFLYSAHQYFDGASTFPYSGTYEASGGYNYQKELAAASAGGSATVSGSGTLAAAGTPRVAAATAVSGSGTVTATPVVGVQRTAAASGSGTTTATGTPRVAASQPLSGSGTLSVSSVVAPAGTVATSGSGTLTASGTVNVAGQAAFSGAGGTAPTQATTPTPAAALSGSGTTTAASSVAATGTAALSGAGTATAAATPQTAADAPLSGSGAVAVTRSVAVVQTAALTGQGTAAATAAVRPITAAAPSGSGTLTAPSVVGTTGTPAAGSGTGTTTVTAAVTAVTQALASGAGTLTSAGVVTAAGTAAGSGSGSLAASPAVQATTTAATAGSGTLTVQSAVAGAVTASAAPNGSGTLTTSAVVGATRTAATSAAGTATATAVVGVPASSPATSGSGNLAVTGVVSVARSVGFSAAGAATPAATPAATTTAALSGVGAATAVARPQVTTTAATSGSGTLTAVGGVAAQISGTAPLTATGQTTATAIVGTQLVAASTGSGTLTVVAVVAVTRTVPLTGTGTTAAAPTVDEPRAVAAAGAGTLNAASIVAAQTGVARQAVGTLTVTAVVRVTMTVALTGDGTTTTVFGLGSVIVTPGGPRRYPRPRIGSPARYPDNPPAVVGPLRY